MATGSLFIIGTRVILRPLEIRPVALGQATVGEYTLPNVFGLKFWKRWQFANDNAGGGGRRMGKGVPFERHGRKNSGVYWRVSLSTIKRIESKGRTAASCI